MTTISVYLDHDVLMHFAPECTNRLGEPGGPVQHELVDLNDMGDLNLECVEGVCASLVPDLLWMELERASRARGNLVSVDLRDDPVEYLTKVTTWEASVRRVATHEASYDSDHPLHVQVRDHVSTLHEELGSYLETLRDGTWMGSLTSRTADSALLEVNKQEVLGNLETSAVRERLSAAYSKKVDDLANMVERSSEVLVVSDSCTRDVPALLGTLMRARGTSSANGKLSIVVPGTLAMFFLTQKLSSVAYLAARNYAVAPADLTPLLLETTVGLHDPNGTGRLNTVEDALGAARALLR